MINRKLSLILICLLLFANLATILDGNTSVKNESTVGPKTSDQEDIPWPMFQGDARHTGRSPYNTSRIDGTVKWNYSTDGFFIPNPAIGSDGTIYVHGSRKNLSAVNPNGTLRWKFSTNEDLSCGPAIGSNGTIYVGSSGGNLYALNPDGTPKWNFSTEKGLSSLVIADDETIYFGSFNNNLYALNPNGLEKWNIKIDGTISSPPAIGLENNIYFTSDNGSFYSVTPEGSKRWTISVPYDTGEPTVGDNGIIYLVGNKNISAFNPNGTKKWSYKVERGGITTSPAIAKDGSIYLSTDEGYLYKLNPNGTLKWVLPLGGTGGSSPVIGLEGTVYVGMGFGGSVNPKYWDGNLYAVNPNGTKKWNISLGFVFTTPAIGPDGTVYARSLDQNLYAIGGPPFTPRDIKCEGLYRKVSLNWSAPETSTADKYRIYRGTSRNNKTLLKEIDSSKTHFVDEEVENGKTYHYHLTAVNDIGESEPSKDLFAVPSKTAPSKPVDVKTSAGKGFVKLNWSEPVYKGGSSITDYRIYRGSDSETKALLDEINASKTYYNDTLVSEDQTYHYHVTAVNAIGEGDPSRNITVSFPIIPPPPTALNSKAGDGYVNLTWEEPEKEVGENITGYKIYRESSSERRTLIGDVNASTHFYNDTSVENGNKYLYTVVSYNDYKSSDISECPTVTGTPSEGDEDGSALIIIGIVAVLALVVISLFIHRRSKRTKEEEEESK